MLAISISVNGETSAQQKTKTCTLKVYSDSQNVNIFFSG